MRAGHDVRFVLDDGYDAWLSLAADLAAAQTAIAIQLYMWTPDAVGDALLAHLVAARQRGVEVQLMLDAFGSMGLPETVLADLAAAGVETKWFGAFDLKWKRFGVLSSLKRWRKRNHRKVFMIDRQVAWISGRNIGAHYYALAPGDATWADASARVTGPLVAELAAILDHEWTGKSGRGRRRPSEEVPASGVLCALALHFGTRRHADVERRYLRAIEVAQNSIRLAQSYFVPTRLVLEGLQRAARAGRSVQVLIPDLACSDVPVVTYATLHVVGRLLQARVQVRALPGRMLHVKMGVVDDAWWTLGSTNLDPLSKLRNREANVAGLGSEQALELSAYFDRLWAAAIELDPTTWRDRPWWQRWLGAMAWRLRGLL